MTNRKAGILIAVVLAVMVAVAFGVVDHVGSTDPVPVEAEGGD